MIRTSIESPMRAAGAAKTLDREERQDAAKEYKIMFGGDS